MKSVGAHGGADGSHREHVSCVVRQCGALPRRSVAAVAAMLVQVAVGAAGRCEGKEKEVRVLVGGAGRVCS